MRQKSWGDGMGWFKTVSDAVYTALCAAFDVQPNSAAGLARFIPAYTENATTPQAPRDKDLCYFALSEMQDTDYDYQRVEYSVKNGVPIATLKKSIPVNALLTFYGPNADDDAEKFWSMFLWDSGPDSPRAILRKKNIVPNGTPKRPISLFETEGTFHRRRCDVNLTLLYLEITEFSNKTQYVEEPPEIAETTQYNN